MEFKISSVCVKPGFCSTGGRAPCRWQGRKESGTGRQLGLAHLRHLSALAFECMRSHLLAQGPFAFTLVLAGAHKHGVVILDQGGQWRGHHAGVAFLTVAASPLCSRTRTAATTACVERRASHAVLLCTANKLFHFLYFSALSWPS